MIKKSVFLFLAFGMLLLLLAAPMKNVPQTITQPNGSVLNCFASGDEFHNWLHDKDNFTIIQDIKSGYYYYATIKNGELVPSALLVGTGDPKDYGLIQGMNISREKYLQRREQLRSDTPKETFSFNAKTLNNLVVFIRFSDQTEFTDLLSTYRNMYNDSVENRNSMYNYFKEVSYEQLHVKSYTYPQSVSSTVASYQDQYPRSYYMPYSGSNTNGYANDTEQRNREHILLKNAIAFIADQVSDSLNLDYNNDGRVDNVCFIVRGGTTAWSTLLWPHMWSLYSQTVMLKGKRVYTYNFQIQTSLSSSGVGVLCHEMYHSLGAPDLYHYEDDGKTPVGPWDIMEQDANPPQHMGAHMKSKYGKWIASIPEITTSGVYTLNPLTESSNNCYKLKSPKSNTEYFVLEYRKKKANFESSLPGSGLLIYRINTAENGNAGGPPDEVYLFRPNGTSTANGSTSLANFNADFGRVKFNHITNPYPFLTNGAPGGIEIKNITSAGETISFEVNVLQGLIVANPKPGESLSVGDVKKIEWINIGSTVANIKIEYSINNGASWQTIANSVPVSSGAYNWTVPNSSTYKGKIRISDAVNSSINSISEGNFSIVPTGNFNMVFLDSASVADVNSSMVKEDYLYIAAGVNGVRVYDISNPSSIELKGMIETAGTAKKIYSIGNLAFVCDEANGIIVLDITNRTNPIEIGHYDTDGSVRDIKIVGFQYAFIADGSKGLKVLDFSDLTQISLVLSKPTGVANTIEIKDNYLFVANENKGIKVFNISDPINIVQIDSLDLPGSEFDISLSDSLLFVASNDYGIRIFNVSNPYDISEISNFKTKGYAIGVSTVGNFVYASCREKGVRIIDVSNPKEPIEAGYFLTTGTAFSSTPKDNLLFISDKGGRGLTVVANSILTGIEEEKNFAEISDYALMQNYPNPFNPTTVINYVIPIESQITLKLFDILGNEVATLIDETKDAGVYSYELSSNKLKIASGVYIYRLIAGDFVKSKKLVLVK